MAAPVVVALAALAAPFLVAFALSMRVLLAAPGRALAAAAWGAVAAVLAALLLSLLPLRAVGFPLAVVLLFPLVEELLKAPAGAAAPPAHRNLAGGAALGALAGLAFGGAEALVASALAASPLAVLAERAVSSMLVHVVAAAVAGAGVAAWRGGRRAALLPALALAVALHAAYNGFVLALPRAVAGLPPGAALGLALAAAALVVVPRLQRG